MFDKPLHLPETCRDQLVQLKLKGVCKCKQALQ